MKNISSIISLAVTLIISVSILFYLNDAKQNIKDDYTYNDSVSTEQPNTQNYYIRIKSVGITAPIIFDVDGGDKDLYLKSLENGVAHLKGSAKPGHKGNAFIFAHSSQIIGGKNQYGEIFRRLNELKEGDEINISNRDIQYSYIVRDKKVVEPTDISVTTQDYSLKQLTLMTCWPLDTIKQRLVITAFI